MQKDATDHPRIRGEHGWPRHHIQPHPGSSPHTRGARSHTAAGQVNGRIIPAYAGSTPTRRPAATSSRDHPRIRGEHHRLGCAGDFGRGSSPHTRGAPEQRRRPPCSARIIPAYAGSTASEGAASRRRRDHPRIRGEHWGDVTDRVIVGGSSPHTRGTPHHPSADGDVDQDHPRIRGEHSTVRQCLICSLGSSPHTRGAQGIGEICTKLGRIIPAYAGSTRSAPILMTLLSDHPRIRGEHGRAPSEKMRFLGSSPHTRGALSVSPGGGTFMRIIPAYAGSTQVQGDGLGRVEDHPRIRGEHVGWAARRPRRRRIIPAYAGSTYRSRVSWAIDPDHPRIRGEHASCAYLWTVFAGSSPHTRGAPGDA